MKQIIAITWINLLSMPRRFGALTMMIVGMAGVVGVLTGMFSLVQGLSSTLMNSAADDRAIVLSDGAHTSGNSALTPDQVDVVARAEGVARTSDGKPAISRDVRISISLEGKEDGILKGVVIRGLSPEVYEIRPTLKLVEGRMYRSGLNEAIVGKDAQSQFMKTAIGERIGNDQRSLKVVGVFESGDWLESGFITDAQTLQSLSESNRTHSVMVKLASPESFPAFAQSLSAQPRMKFQPLREIDYYRRLDDAFSRLGNVSLWVGAIMSIGGLFCAFNVMYSTVSSRRVEIATFKAIGFGPAGIVVSVVVESLLVAIVGAVIGAVVVWLLFNGMVMTTGGYDASVVHHVNITVSLLIEVIAAACTIALMGALVPAIEAARLPVTQVLGR